MEKVHKFKKNMDMGHNEKIKINSHYKKLYNSNQYVNNCYLFPTHAYLGNMENSRPNEEFTDLVHTENIGENEKENWIVKVRGWSFLQKQRNNYHWLTNVSQYIFNKKNRNEEGKERTDERISYFLDLINNRETPITVKFLGIMTQDEVNDMMKYRLKKKLKNTDILKLIIDKELFLNTNRHILKSSSDVLTSPLNSYDKKSNKMHKSHSETLKRTPSLELKPPHEEFELITSNAGHFNGQFKLDTEKVSTIITANKLHKYIKIKAENTIGIAELIPRYGLSVISDIDDTIKETFCTHGKKAIFQSTIMNEWVAVQGMPEIYLNWYIKGLSFHYVSASPWQLYPILENFLQMNNFPPGSFHLKLLSMTEKSKIFQSPQQTKLTEILDIFNCYPQRKFILVGDSGQFDIELYSQIAFEKPNQVEMILIRNVHQDNQYEHLITRCINAFKDLPKNISYVLFKDSYDLLENKTLTNIINASCY